MSPRPPAPCSLAPGLPLSCRPAPRRMLAVIALAVLTIVIIFPVSAIDSEFLEDSGLNYVDFTYSGVDTSISTVPRDILINNVINWTDITSVYVRATLYGTYYAASTEQNYYEPVNFLVGDEVIGSGYAGYNLFSPPDDTTRLIYGQFWVDIDDIDFSGYVGTQFIKIVPIEGDLYNNIIVRAKPHSNALPPDNQFPVVFGHQTASGKFSGVYGLHISRAEYEWKNGIEITDDVVKIVRNYDGIAYYSIINISTPNDSVIEAGYNDITLRYVGHPVTWTVTSPQNTVFTGIYNPDSGGGPSPLVTVYVRNSQTGALLADARLSILASAGGTETEIINTTLPGGTATYTLQPTGGGAPNPDYYRAVATVPGFSQIIENHSFTLSGPHDVIIEMRPDTGGPTDPDRAYLEFYVRDLNANGIPSASVQCAGMIRQTNSKGYLVIEVAKNATYPYVVKKSGYVTIEGTATVADGPRYTANVVLGPGSVPTHTPTPGPGETPGGPGATPTPDTRSNEQKGQAIIDLIADFAEPIAILAILATIFGLMKMMTPGRR